MVNEESTTTYDVKITCDCCGAVGTDTPGVQEPTKLRQKLRSRGWLFRYVTLEYPSNYSVLLALCGVCTASTTAKWFRNFVHAQEDTRHAH